MVCYSYPKRILVYPRLSCLQIGDAYRLVCAEVARGENIGVDEIPSEDYFRFHVTHVDAFSVTDRRTAALRALLTVAPSGYSRMLYPLLADSVIICDGLLRRSLVTGLITIVTQLATDLGYKVSFYCFLLFCLV